MNEQSIADYIVSVVQQQPEILGSQLGSMVKQVFPQFQGLKSFIERNCGGQVVILRRYGPDFVYAHASQLGHQLIAAPPPITPQPSINSSPAVTETSSPAVTPSTAAVEYSPVGPGSRVGYGAGLVQFPQKPIRSRNRLGPGRLSDRNFGPASVWSAFTNPTLGDRLAVDKTTGNLQVLQHGAFPQLPFAEVSKVTAGEHRQIVIDYLASIEPIDRPYFLNIASAPNPWPMWYSRIKDFAGGKYMSAWLDFRTASLQKLFKQRLEQLGLEQSKIEDLVVKLLESKERRPREPNQVPQKRPYIAQDDHAPPTIAENEMRRIASFAISQMSTEELRRLWLPLGAIVNSLRGHDS